MTVEMPEVGVVDGEEAVTVLMNRIEQQAVRIAELECAVKTRDSIIAQLRKDATGIERRVYERLMRERDIIGFVTKKFQELDG